MEHWRIGTKQKQGNIIFSRNNDIIGTKTRLTIDTMCITSDILRESANDVIRPAKKRANYFQRCDIMHESPGLSRLNVRVLLFEFEAALNAFFAH